MMATPPQVQDDELPDQDLLDAFDDDSVDDEAVDFKPSASDTTFTLALRCHAPVELATVEEIVASKTITTNGRSRLDTVEIGNWFGETWLDGGLICAAAGTSDAGVFLLWKGTHWEEIPDAYVEDDIDQLFRSPRLTAEIVKLIRRRTWQSRAALDRNGSRLFLRNCVLEFRDGGVVQHPHRPSDYNTYFVALDYDSSCTLRPLWESYLQRAVPEQDGRDLLQEIFGYCLLRNLDFQCFFVLPGPAATGKSTTTDVLNYLIGGKLDPLSGKIVSKYVTSKGLECLGERFGTAGLERSLVNISSESTYLNAAAEGVLKKLTGGDAITVEYKNRDAFTVSCAPKIIVATNEIPRFSERSEALNQRVVILPFTQELDLAKAEANIAAKIFEAEAQAILNWAIAGLLRLLGRTGMRRERFTKPVASVLAAEEHRRDSNPIVEWVEERLERASGEAVTREAAHQDFVAYMSARANPASHPVRQYNNFVKAMNAELRRRGFAPGRDDRLRVDGTQRRVFRGVRLPQISLYRDGNCTDKVDPKLTLPQNVVSEAKSADVGSSS